MAPTGVGLRFRIRKVGQRLCSCTTLRHNDAHRPVFRRFVFIRRSVDLLFSTFYPPICINPGGLIFILDGKLFNGPSPGRSVEELSSRTGLNNVWHFVTQAIHYWTEQNANE